MNSSESVSLGSTVDDLTTRIEASAERSDRTLSGKALAIHERFYGQPVTGVQRYVREICMAMDGLLRALGSRATPVSPSGATANLHPQLSRWSPRGERLGMSGRWLYAHALCLAFPSLSEGFGSLPAEVMALGCPVVSSERSVLPEIHRKAALIADPDDALA